MDNKNKNKIHPFKMMILASLSAQLAVLFSHPFDLTKTRLQLDGELKKSSERKFNGSWLKCIKLNYQYDGIYGLWRGLSMALIREGGMNFFRIGFYEPILSKVHTGDSPPSLSLMIAVGGLTGCLGAIIVNPVEVIKIRMQSFSASGASVGHQHGYKNAGDAFSHLWRDEGFRGMTKGVTTSATRLMVGSATQLPTYHKSKMYFIQHGWRPENPLLHVICSATSAAVNPFDVVRTRLYNQPFDHTTGKGLWYKSGTDAFFKILKKEGPLSFWKGALTHYFRLGPHLVLVFGFLEQFKRLAKKHW